MSQGPQEPGSEPAPPYPSYPSYGAAPYGGPSFYAPPKPTNAMAIAAMVVSILSALGVLLLCGVGGIFGIVGAILGHVARGQIRRQDQQGDGFALAGIIVGWLAFVIALIVIVVFAVLILGFDHSASMDDMPTSV